MSGDGYQDNAAAAARVLAAVWCRSVGTSWTLELRKLRRGTALGPVVDWINSGVLTSQPASHALLTQRGLHLFRVQFTRAPDAQSAPATCAETLN